MTGSRIEEARRRVAGAKKMAVAAAAAGFLAVVLLALVHGLTARTDAGTPWALLLSAASAWLVLALTVHRVASSLGRAAARTSKASLPTRSS
jgi:hypothetical protein